MDAFQFRQRAEQARQMALAGDDVRLVHMLLEVADEMDAEADAIETERQACASAHPAAILSRQAALT